MYKITGLFPEPFLETKIDNWDQCKKEIFLDIENSKKPLPITGSDMVNASNSFTAENILIRCPNTRIQVENYLNCFSNEVGIKELTIVNSWVSKYEKGQMIGLHRHIPKHVSGVIFLTEGHIGGHFCFQSSKFDIDSILLDNQYEEKTTLYNESFRAITPEEGKLIIFNSYMNHGTTPNLDDKIRYTLAFNAMAK